MTDEETFVCVNCGKTIHYPAEPCIAAAGFEPVCSERCEHEWNLGYGTRGFGLVVALRHVRRRAMEAAA